MTITYITLTQAICCAEPNSDALSFAYANRSAVFYEMALHAECLESIKSAMAQNGFPTRLLSTLNERKKLSLDAIETKKKLDNDTALPAREPKLCMKANEKIPFIVDCLEMQRNERCGRFIVTTQDLKIGDVIGIEEPYCTTLAHDKLYEWCDNCCMENARNLIPCTTCTRAMYCSEKCRTEAFERFHKYECPVIDFLRRNMPWASWRLGLRMTMCALSDFKTIDALVAFTDEADKDDDYTVFSMDYSIGNTTAKQSYGPVYGLQRQEPTPDSQHVLEKVLKVLCSHMLVESTVLECDEKTLNILLDLLDRHFHAIAISQCVMVDLGTLIERLQVGNGANDDDTIGILPFRSLFGHACVANVISSVFGSKMVYSVVKPIKAGEAVCINYR